jgi:hypothetical protein
MASEDAVFNFWLSDLTLQQKRALASQAGITGWAVRDELDLEELLMDSDRARQIHEVSPVG